MLFRSLVPLDHVLNKLSHREYLETPGADILLQELSQLNQNSDVRITGGEPFLYNEFPHLLNSLDQAQRVQFYTGLGVNTKRLHKQLSSIKQRSNLQVTVSAENCGKFYEFNRHGNTYHTFLQNLKLLEDFGFSINFNAVVSNLTVFGLDEFSKTFSHVPITYQLCNDPDFLSVNVLDDTSKQILTKTLSQSSISIKDTIVQNMAVEPTPKQQQNFSKYIKEFTKRRNLDLDMFPDSMLEWIKHVV